MHNYAYMKFLTSKKIVFFANLAILAITVGIVGMQNPTAYASKTAETKATEYCSKISGANDLATQQRAACHSGFVKGYDATAKDREEACKNFQLSKESACEDGFAAGKEAREDAPEIDGREGAKAKISQSAACGKYRNPANLATCKRAYDNQIIAMAKLAGQTAGREGKDSPCNSLGFGGAAAKSACEAAYRQGKIALGKTAKGHCGEVATYFDFSKICEDSAGKDLSVKDGGNKNPIIAIGLAIVGIITALVALAVVGGIIYGGFLYLTARDNSGQTQKGVTIIVNSGVALVVWLFAYALINFLVPGGLFNG